MNIILLTKVTTPVINWVAELMGLIMNLLFKFTNLFGIENIGLCIILFTIIVNLLLLPLTIKQQKATKLTAIMQPEIQAIQKKYQGKKDQNSQMKMQAETQAVYDKYGTSMLGGCGPLLIQFPILIALYQVIYHIPGYVPQIKAIIEPLVAEVQNITNYQNYAGFSDIVTAVKLTNVDLGESANLIDFFYKLNPTQWGSIANMFPSISELVQATEAALKPANTFLGINLSEAPWQGFKPAWSWLIPALAGITQWLSAKIMTVSQPQMNDEDNPTASSMKTMNTMMPLMSVFFCFTLPSGIGVYWIASAVCRTIIQVPINKWSAKIDTDELIKQNIEKTNKKRAKKGLPPIGVDKKAQAAAAKEERLKNYEEQKKALQKEKSDKQVIDSTQYYNLNAKPGSLASKANMVAMYEQREYEKRHGKKKTETAESAADNKEN